MEALTDIRRANLNAYCVRRGWISQKTEGIGSPSKLKEALGRTDAFWSDRVSGRKGIGAELAREIEERLDLPKYSLDGDEEASDFVPITRLDVEVGAGRGRVSSVIEEIGSLQFRRDFLKSAGVSAGNAAIVNVRGESMDPTIKGGAVLLINRSDRTPRHGQIYAFSWGGDMLVKRFFKRGDGWIASSDNPDKSEYPDIVLDGNMETIVQGRAIWMGAKL